MELQHEQAENHGRFFAREDGAERGVMAYVRRNGVATIRHTEVQKRAEGRGIGKRLVSAAVAWARHDGVKLNAT